MLDQHDELFPHLPRAQDRAADWQRQLSRAYAYQIRQVSPEEAAALHAEYEKRMAAGPDHIRYRRDSSFMEAPITRLDRNERARLIIKFRTIARGSWSAKSSGRHRGAITRTAESVFEALMYLATKYDRLYPSLEGLAHLALCCKQSVVTALDDLERLGFITRHRRIRRVMTPLGLRAVQTTNAYEIHEPARGLGWLAAAIFCRATLTDAANTDEGLTGNPPVGGADRWLTAHYRIHPDIHNARRIASGRARAVAHLLQPQ